MGNYLQIHVNNHSKTDITVFQMLVGTSACLNVTDSTIFVNYSIEANFSSSIHSAVSNIKHLCTVPSVQICVGYEENIMT